VKQRRLIWQLYPSFLILTLLVLVAISWLVLAELRDFHYRQTSQDLLARAQLASEQLHLDLEVQHRAALMAKIERLGTRSSTRITVIQNDGTVIADSDEDPRRMDNHARRPEVIAALQQDTGVSTRFSNTLGETLMYVALPIYDNGALFGTLRTARPLSDIDRTFRSIYEDLIAGGVLISLLAAPLCWWLSRRLSLPLEKMTAGAQRFAMGELQTPLEESGSEESCRLAAAMNQMAIKLSQLIDRETGQRQEIEAVLGSMIEAVVAVDHQQRVIRTNPAAAQLFGITDGPLTGRPIQELIRQAELLRFVQKALASPEPIEDELLFHGAQQRYIHALATPLSAHGDEQLGVLLVMHDLTRLRQLESLRRDFVANVSHELKTPITAIRGSVETLLEHTENDIADQQFLKIIDKQGQRLNALVEDLLDLSRIEQSALSHQRELHRDPLLPVLESARTACESLMLSRQVTLKVSCPGSLQLKMDSELLEQAIINLLTNAIKYSERGGRVLLSASVRDDNMVLIQVQDFGCGIAAEHLPRLFERFYRVDRARSRQLGGTGLGLAIVKHVAQAHQGTVSVNSQPDQGSIFTLILPQNTPHDPS